MSKRTNQYPGKAGHLVAMSEFLLLGWYAAIPEVDTGDDIFAVEDEKGTLRRVQVKTATAKGSVQHFTAQFQVSCKQLKNIRETLIHYAFLIRLEKHRQELSVIPQHELLDYHENKKAGSKCRDKVALYFSCRNGRLLCAKQDFPNYIGNFRDFPFVSH